MPCKPFRFWLIPLLLGPACALALEIGEIQVSSALNQLFDARIPLPKLTPDELARVSVRLAPPPMFKEFGLDRAPALAHLVFSIEYNAEDQVYVRIVSTRPIREPSLALLLEFGWPRGKTFREFTVFLDPVQRLAGRPGDRTKTVLDAPAAAAAVGPEPPPPALTTEPASPEPEPTVVATVPEIAEPPAATPPLPVETPPPPARLYKPGDSYGPVATRERLWDIAAKVRPDPGITREQMMQALFRANPQAFARTGIDGLKAGSTLRVPTLREIAEFTDSTAARRLAEAETAPSPAQTVAGGAEAFPLEPPAAFEPTVVAAMPHAPMAPSIKPAPEPVAAAGRVAPPILEPVAATPLLFLAVSEVMASVVQIPAFAIPAQIAPASIIAPAPTPEPAPIAPASAAVPPDIAAGQGMESPDASSRTIATDAAAPAAPVETAVATMLPMDATELLAVVESRIPPTVLDWTTLSPVNEASVTPPPVAESESAIQPDPASAAANGGESEPPSAAVAGSPAVASPSAEAAESPAVVAGEPSAPDPAKPTGPVYQGGDQYGPVAPNERLWDIAAKVRPDPGIGKDLMMRALFKANPQAFSRPGMDSLKIGATLRIPSLQEIADYTGSEVAKRLLERQPAAETKAAESTAGDPSSTLPATIEPTEANPPSQTQAVSDGMSEPAAAVPTPDSGETAAGLSPVTPVANSAPAVEPNPAPAPEPVVEAGFAPMTESGSMPEQVPATAETPPADGTSSTR